MLKLLSATAALGMALGGAAGMARAGEPVVLETITVKGEAVPAASQPVTVNVIDEETIGELKLLRPEKLLEEVPGIEIHNYGQAGVANEFAIRGFNNGGHGGDAAIYLDGIPLNEGESHADGYADMNVIIPLEIERVEVYKGPSSPLFGNFARGGAISFHTRKKGEYTTFQTIGGSYDTYDLQTVFGRQLSDTVQNNTALQFASSEGYQDHSSWQRGNFSTRFGWQATEQLDTALSLRVHRSEWDAPGYIPESQFKDEDDARHQAANAEDDGGDKTFTTQRFDVGYNLSGNARLLAWAYATQQDFTRFAKFGYDPGGQTERYYDRDVYGAGTSYNYEGEMAGRRLSGVAGLEYFSEETDWERYNTSDRVRTAQTEDRTFTIKTLSLFGELDYGLHPLFEPWLGIRFDSFSGDYENRDPGTTPSESDMNDYDEVSPKVGFHSKLYEGLDFRASYSQGFVLPSGPDKYNAAIDAQAETINQYEVGLAYAPGSFFSCDLAVFQIDTENEIQEYPDGSGNYESLGETRRRGLEFSAQLRPGIDGLELFGDLTVIDSEIRQHANPALVGKEVTGVPDYTTDLGLRYRHDSGANSRIKWRHVDSYYIDSANLASYEGYDVVDFSLGYEALTGRGYQWRIGFDIDNLFDEHYSQSVWNGYGTNNYAVSPGRTFWLRLALDI